MRSNNTTIAPTSEPPFPPPDPSLGTWLVNTSQGQLGSHGCPTLQVSGQEMAMLCKSSQARTLLALPGDQVEYEPNGPVDATSIDLELDSCVHAIMIQSRGSRRLAPCTQCEERWTQGNTTAFPICHTVPGHLDECCGNCKWNDWGNRCSYADGTPLAIGSSAMGYGQARAGSAQDPIPIKDSDSENGYAKSIVLKDDDELELVKPIKVEEPADTQEQGSGAGLALLDASGTDPESAIEVD